MTAFYPRPSAPITPPDSGSRYGYSNMHYPMDPYSNQQNSQNIGYDYSQAFISDIAACEPTYQYPASGFQASSNSLPPIQTSYYEPIGAPILPPLRINERGSFVNEYQRRVEEQQAAAREQQRQTAKEEKATGGVSAKLDYDMERMTDFVVDATQSIFQHPMTSPTSFRKWVHQVLSATRLPSATILLSLHYLSDRLHRFPTSYIKGNENQVYRLLAVSLILGSKFLDDNTFVNKSWSDVTAVKVRELNELERNWLALIDWTLHVDTTKADGLPAWIDAWKEYDQRALQKQQAASRMLSPLDTNNVYRHTSNGRDRFSPYPSPYSAKSYEQLPSARSLSHSSSTYDSVDHWAGREGHQGIDNFYRSQHRYPTLTEFDSVNNNVARRSDDRQTAYNYTAPVQQSYYPTPTYATGWDQQAWTASHSYDCPCSHCIYQNNYRSHPMSSGYSAQPVMG